MNFQFEKYLVDSDELKVVRQNMLAAFFFCGNVAAASANLLCVFGCSLCGGVGFGVFHCLDKWIFTFLAAFS